MKFNIQNHITNILPLLGGLVGLLLFASCQEWDVDRAEAALQPLSEDSYTSQLNGDDLVWTWSGNNGTSTQVNVYNNGSFAGSETVTGNSYTFTPAYTNVNYTFVFKQTDGTNYSSGVVKKYLREGATQISGISMSQVDKVGGYDATVTWNAATDATSIKLIATNGKQTINETLAGTATSYTIKDVTVGDTWNVTLIAVNDKGTSLKAASSLKIGKTAVGFLSIYATPEDLIANGDDDEASAWLWFKSEYPTGKFVSFSSITSQDVVDPYRVLWWIRDLEGVDEKAVFTMPDAVQAATPYIQSWYKDGGSMLLWGHAIPFAASVGRIQLDWISGNDHAIGTGKGGYNGDVWKMAVQLNPGSKFVVDMSSHPIYKGIDCETSGRTKLIAFKGAGWTEDHNCLFFNLPSQLTGLGNQDLACYTTLTETYGIYPLGTWDSQIDWVSQLNVWEARQGNTQYKGTILCIGNGGCEFSMKNADGTPDKSTYPKNNSYQENVLKLAKNSLEYLKTR